MLKLLDFGGNPNVGVYARATDRHFFATPALSKKEVAEAVEALQVPALLLRVGGSNILGSLIAANSQGAVVPDFAEKAELRHLEKLGLRVFRLREPPNAAGNNVLATDKGALCNPDISEADMRQMEKALGVPVTKGTLAGLGTVGMAGVATARGVLVHPKSTSEERETARRALGADVHVGTINHGTGLIGAGLVANAKGALIGSLTTAIEIGRIEDALGVLEEPVA